MNDVYEFVERVVFIGDMVGLIVSLKLQEECVFVL